MAPGHHHLNQCWPKSWPSYGIIRPLWVTLETSCAVKCLGIVSGIMINPWRYRHIHFLPNRASFFETAPIPGWSQLCQCFCRWFCWSCIMESSQSSRGHSLGPQAPEDPMGPLGNFTWGPNGPPKNWRFCNYFLWREIENLLNCPFIINMTRAPNPQQKISTAGALRWYSEAWRKSLNFASEVSKWIFFDETFYILIQIWLKFVP